MCPAPLPKRKLIPSHFCAEQALREALGIALFVNYSFNPKVPGEAVRAAVAT